MKTYLLTGASNADSNQPASCLHEENPWLSKMRPVKILIRPQEYASWSESWLGAHDRRYIFWHWGSNLNPSPAEPRYTLPLQTLQIQISWLLQKPTDLDQHCLQCSMWSYINNLDQVIWLAENYKWVWHVNLFSMTRVNWYKILYWLNLVAYKSNYRTACKMWIYVNSLNCQTWIHVNYMIISQLWRLLNPSMLYRSQ